MIFFKGNQLFHGYTKFNFCPSLTENPGCLEGRTGHPNSKSASLQLNLVKTKEIVFRRLNMHFNILPVQLDNSERLECVK